MRAFLTLVLIASNTSCSLGPELVATKQEVIAGIKVERDDYEKMLDISTAFTRISSVTFSEYEPSVSFALNCRINEKNNTFFHRLYLLVTRGDWLFLQSATDRDGERLRFMTIDRDVWSGGTVAETVVVVLSDSYLQEHADAGLDLKISGRAMDVVVQVPPHYVQGYLSATREHVGERSEVPLLPE